MSTEQGSHAHTSIQPTLIVLANFEKRRKMTKTALLMIQVYRQMLQSKRQD
jgi:hypothetical protein